MIVGLQIRARAWELSIKMDKACDGTFVFEEVALDTRLVLLPRLLSQRKSWRPKRQPPPRR
jgi:hypothetical protein